jgi:hypothetical protein
MPAKLMSPSKPITAMKARKVMAKLDPTAPEKIEKNSDAINMMTEKTMMTGPITAIKLAVNPNFLPDSSDTLIPASYISILLDKLFVTRKNHIVRYGLFG